MNATTDLSGATLVEETPIDADRPIIDPHHHLWDHGSAPGVVNGAKPFLLQEFLRLVDASGHHVTQTVYVECVSMYRREGPKDLRPVGETEFANGMAAMAASGRYGDCRVAAGIVATANLRLGLDVQPILEAQIAAGNGRLRGLRFSTAYADAGLFGREPDLTRKGVLSDPAFRDAVRLMHRYGLSLDVFCVHSQLAELSNLAAACADTRVILDHIGTPLRFDAHLGSKAEVFPIWRSHIVELSRRPNVVVKIGGLGMDVTSPIGTSGGQASSIDLAERWRPYVDTCLDAFGVDRCMFESNFPVDSATCTYGALWNAFKRISAACHEDEKTALFSGTAAAVYRLN